MYFFVFRCQSFRTSPTLTMKENSVFEIFRSVWHLYNVTSQKNVIFSDTVEKNGKVAKCNLIDT